MSSRGNRLPFGHFSQKTTERLKEIQLHFKKHRDSRWITGVVTPPHCGMVRKCYRKLQNYETCSLWTVTRLDDTRSSDMRLQELGS